MTTLSYRRPISTWWWLRKRSYFVFVMRELSSVFVAWLVVLNAVAFLFVLLHVVTWFNLTPQAMDVRVRGTRVPPVAIIAAQYVGLAVASGFVLWLVTS